MKIQKSIVNEKHMYTLTFLLHWQSGVINSKSFHLPIKKENIISFNMAFSCVKYVLTISIIKI